jgi:hypothetical protein
MFLNGKMVRERCLKNTVRVTDSAALTPFRVSLRARANLAGGPAHAFVQPANYSSSDVLLSGKRSLHIFCDNSATVGIRPAGVSLSTSPGRTCESCLVMSSSDIPDF